MVALAVFVSHPNHLSDAAVMVMLAAIASSPIRWTYDIMDSVETGSFLTDLLDIDERVLKRNLSIIFAFKKII